MRIKSLLAAVSLVALATAAQLPLAYADSNAGSKVYVCADPQPADLDQAAYEALTWVEVSNVGNFGETGSNTNILTYDEWGTDVIQKSKGITDAGSPTIECSRNATDPGQVIMNAIARTNFNYAIKVQHNDAETVGGTGSTFYHRGLVTGPTRPQGRNEDFILEVFTFAINQREVKVDPT